MANNFPNGDARYGKMLDAVANIVELRDYPIAGVENGDPIIVLSNATLGDGNGAVYGYDKNSVAVDDGIKIIRPSGADNGRWIRSFGRGEFSYSDTDFAAALVRLNAARKNLAQEFSAVQTFLSGIKSDTLKANGTTLTLGEATKAVNLLADALNITATNIALTGPVSVSGALSANGGATFAGNVVLPSTLTVGGVSLDDKYQTKAKYSSMIQTALTSYSLPLLPPELIETTSSSATTITIPADTTTNIAVGARIDFFQIGSGQVTITPASGVTIRSDANKTKIKGQNAGATIYKRAANDWVLVGALA